MTLRTVQRVREIAGAVSDPELPALTLAELGILRDVVTVGERVVVSLTPTYSGCPAMQEIRHDVARSLAAAGFEDVEVRTQLRPAWSSDWISETGRRKLVMEGIAPPQSAPQRRGPVPLRLSATRRAVACPRCASLDTEVTSEFAATACMALYRCRGCSESFQYVKEI